jgi:excisionase family DNA binding protein
MLSNRYFELKPVIMLMTQFVTINQLAEITGIPVRELRTLVAKRVLPCVRLGHRTLKFQPEKVKRALEKREVKEIA